jgi:hypothetical protein
MNPDDTRRHLPPDAMRLVRTLVGEAMPYGFEPHQAWRVNEAATGLNKELSATEPLSKFKNWNFLVNNEHVGVVHEANGTYGSATSGENGIIVLNFVQTSGVDATVSGGPVSRADRKLLRVVCYSDVARVGRAGLPEVRAGLPGNTTVLGAKAFALCTSLNKIILPPRLEKIGEYAFRNCTSLSEIVLPPRLEKIGESAFRVCRALTKIALPPTLAQIGQFAFAACTSLTKIELPPGITTIERHTFKGCTSLAEIVLPPTLTDIKAAAFQKCTSLSEIALPPTVVVLGESAFADCESLVQVTLPPDLTIIGDYAFEGCKALREVVLPPAVTEIGFGSFEGCTSLREIVLPPSLVTIEALAFAESGLRNVIAAPGLDLDAIEVAPDAFPDGVVLPGQPGQPVGN